MTIPAPPRRKLRRGNQSLLEQYLNQELDRHKQEIGAEGQSVTEAEHEAWLAKNPKRYALHRATEERDIGPMRELVKKMLGSEFVRYVRFPKSDKRVDRKEYLDARPKLKAVLDTKTLAVWEARRAQSIMKRGRFVGYQPRTFWKVAADRAGLTVDEVRDWEKQCSADPWPVVPLPE
jgi:hypothetical protein